MNYSLKFHKLHEHLTEEECQFFSTVSLSRLNNTFKMIKSNVELEILDKNDILLIIRECSDRDERFILEVNDVIMTNNTLYDIIASFEENSEEDEIVYNNIFNITPMLDLTLNDETYEQVYNHFLDVVKNNRQEPFENAKIIDAEKFADKHLRNDNDLVNHPSHYNYGDIEVIDYIKQVTKGYSNHSYEAYCIGNVIKYISRAPYKNGREDLEKAKWYLESALESYEEE